MRSKTKRTWTDLDMISRIGAVFGKPPRFGQTLEEYIEFLDQTDRGNGLPFSFTSLNVYPYKEPVVSYMCFPSKQSTDFLDFVSSYDGEPFLACDPMLKGKHSSYIGWYDKSSTIYNEKIPYLLRAWGEGKPGMIVSSFREGEALVAVPARWFINANA